MLLVGFSKEQGDAAEGWMHQMEPELLISHCTAATLDGTVEQAVTGAGMEQTSAEEHQHGNEVMPRLVLLSGMSGEEAIAIAEHWEEYTGRRFPKATHYRTHASRSCSSSCLPIWLLTPV